mgnify:CR=1 FL=1
MPISFHLPEEGSVPSMPLSLSAVLSRDEALLEAFSTLPPLARQQLADTVSGMTPGEMACYLSQHIGPGVPPGGPR